MKKPIGKLGTTLIILSTIILAGIAIFTAFRLYQLRQESVAPNVPSSFPKAESTTPSTNNCSLSFTITDAVTPTPTATATASATPRITPTATATATATASATPRITPTATATSTVASTATPTATPKVTSAGVVTPTPTEAALPVSGTSWPTLFGAGFGILIILGAILLVL